MLTIRPFALLAVLVAGEGPFRDLGFDAALKAAQAEKRVVLVDFFTTWCVPCKKLDSVTWKDERVRTWLQEKAVPLKLDAEKEAELAARFHVDVYPTILLLRPDGTEIDRLVGYRNPEKFLAEAGDALAGKDAIARARQALVGHAEAPMLRQALAKVLAEKGQYDEALREYLWCYDHGAEKAGYYDGVRTTFLVSDIGRLAKKHAPARAALDERRSALVARILAGQETDAPGVVTFDRALGQMDRSLELYDQLGAKGPEFVKLQSAMVMPLLDTLIEHKRYADVVANAMDVPKSLEKKIARYRRAQEQRAKPDAKDVGDEIAAMLAEAPRFEILEMAKTYTEAYLGVGQVDVATKIAELALDFDPSAETCAALMESAKRAGKPEVARAIEARWIEKLPEPERAKARKAAGQDRDPH